ncbi:MAG: hypothetical protein GVX78_01995, partial [Bacteroidetes bacterium]|nr:hypothetical protein [Bacteroidota bacterium]
MCKSRFRISVFCILTICSSGLLMAQNFIKDYPHFVALNTGQSQAVEDLGFSSLGSPALSLNKGSRQFAASFRQLTMGEFGLRHIQAGAKQVFQSKQHIGFQARYTGNSAVHLL